MRQLLLGAAALLASSSWAADNISQMHHQAMMDDKGRPFSAKQDIRRPTIVTMEYADCKFLCSITLQRLKDAQTQADKLGLKYDFLVVSLSPKTDTPEAWAAYRKSRDLNRENWRFVTPANQTELTRVARFLGVKYWLYDGHIMHDFRLLRFDKEGDLLKVADRYDVDFVDFLSVPLPE